MNELPIWMTLLLLWVAGELIYWLFPWSVIALGVVFVGLIVKTLFDEWQLDEALADDLRRIATQGREQVLAHFEIGRDLLRRNFDDTVQRMDEIVTTERVERLLATESDNAERVPEPNYQPQLDALRGGTATPSSVQTLDADSSKQKRLDALRRALAGDYQAEPKDAP